MKIAILGGSFDPPHIGHLLVAQTVKKLLNIDQVWLLPTYSHPFHKPLATTKHRLAITKLLEDGILKVSDFAITKKGTSYTTDTLKQVSETYPEHSFYWISGSDQIKNYPQWKNWQEFLQTYKIIIYSRGEEKETIEQELKAVTGWNSIPNTIFILASKDLPNIDISSETIQEKVRTHQSIRGLVPKRVEQYIAEHMLYR